MLKAYTRPELTGKLIRVITYLLYVYIWGVCVSLFLFSSIYRRLDTNNPSLRKAVYLAVYIH